MKRGVTRIVFKIGNYVIKIPNHSYSHFNFLNGCYANWCERNYYKKFKCIKEQKNKIAPSLYCSVFGLIQIQKYCKPINRELTNEELEYFSDVRNGETKKENFGIYNNTIVCVDYSY